MLELMAADTARARCVQQKCNYLASNHYQLHFENLCAV